MKGLVWIVMLGAIGYGGYYGWQSFGQGKAATYRLEKLGQKACNQARAEFRTDGNEFKAEDAGKQLILDEGKERLGLTLIPEDVSLDLEGDKSCTGFIQVHIEGKMEKANFSRSY